MDDTLTVFKMKRSAAWQARNTFNDLLHTTPMPVAKCYEILQIFFVDDDIIRSWCNVLEILMRKGELYISERQRIDLITDATAQFAKKSTFELDPTSRLLMMGSVSDGDTVNFHMRFPDCLISNFKIPGTYGCIEGLPRSGKTSLSVTFMKIFGEVFHFRVLTNIKIEMPPDYIEYCPTLSKLVGKMVNKGKWICILDETATYVPKKKALSTANIDFENLARFIGKLNGRMLLVTHDFSKDVPTILQTWISERYKKIDLDKIKVDLTKNGGYVKMHKIISGVSDAELLFITEDITSLKFDISITDLLHEIQDTDINDQTQNVLNYLSKVKEKKEKRGSIDIAYIINTIDLKVNTGVKKAKAFLEVSNELNIPLNTLKTYYYSNH